MRCIVIILHYSSISFLWAIGNHRYSLFLYRQNGVLPLSSFPTFADDDGSLVHRTLFDVRAWAADYGLVGPVASNFWLTRPDGEREDDYPTHYL